MRNRNQGEPRVVLEEAASYSPQSPLNTRAPKTSTSSKPSWQFSTADKEGAFKWPAGEDIELEILDKLRHFDGMEWKDIDHKHQHLHHSIAVEYLSKEAQKRLSQRNMKDDTDQVFSFRLSGKERVICIRYGNIANCCGGIPNIKSACQKRSILNLLIMNLNLSHLARKAII